jgi:alpha-amylase
MNSPKKINPDHYLVLYFEVHQPKRLKPFRFFDIGSHTSYFNDEFNKEIIRRVAMECYLPANTLLLKLLGQYPNIKIAFSISGIMLDQLEEYAPEVLDSFRFLALTGRVEFLGETNYHSLSSLMTGDEFETQVLEHAEKIQYFFGDRPNVFRNTELIYNDEIGTRVSNLGFQGIFCEGVDRVLNGRSPHYLYQHPDENGLKIFLRNYRLSDDIAFRYNSNGKKLTVETYMNWLKAIPKEEQLVNIAMDYETFGEHHRRQDGILKFLEEFLIAASITNRFKMVTPSEALNILKPKDTFTTTEHISWADQERDLSAWLGNEMQRDAFDSLLKLEPRIKKVENPELLRTWCELQTSDHFYYMSTKAEGDGTVHSYFSPFPSPYEAFMTFMNVVSDFILQVQRAEVAHQKEESTKVLEFERRHEGVPIWAEKYAASYDHGHLN